MTQLIAGPGTVCPPRCRIVKLTWQTQTPPSHEFLAFICSEEDGGFSVFAARYSGIVSQGETVDEAKSNIAEAFAAVLEACRKRGKPLDYSNESVIEAPKNCQQVWITVDG